VRCCGPDKGHISKKECAVTSEALWGPEKGRICKAVRAVTGEVSWSVKMAVFVRVRMSDRCQRNSGCSSLASAASDWEPASLLRIGGRGMLLQRRLANASDSSVAGETHAAVTSWRWLAK
jgi:hypothetical protein